jgi:hypothetical protein
VGTLLRRPHYNARKLSEIFMNRLRIVFSLLCITVLFGVSTARAADDPFAGTYRGDTISVEITPTANGYGGTIALASQRFPLTATTAGGQLRGSFTSGGNSFDFTLAADGNRYTLRSGTAVYVLSRVAAPAANPLAPDNRGPAAPAQPHDDSVRFTRTGVIDPMSNNQVALTMLVPSDWKTEGGVIWRWNAFYPTTLHMRLFNPNGAEQMTYYPSLLFTDGVRESVWKSAIVAGPEIAQQMVAKWPDGSNYMGFEVRTRSNDPVAVLRDFALPRYRKDLVGLRPVSVKELPEVAKATAADYQGMQVEIKAVAVRFEYKVQDVPIEEEFHCTLVAVPTLPPMVSWGMEFQSFRARKGELDAKMPLFQAMHRSATLDLKWYAGMCSVQEMMKDGIRQSIDNAGKISKYIAQRNDEVTQIIREGYETRQKSQDRIHEAFSHYIRGVEKYKDPSSSHPMELPSGYNHAYMSPRGEIILNNSGENPGIRLHEEWKELPKTRG